MHPTASHLLSTIAVALAGVLVIASPSPRRPPCRAAPARLQLRRSRTTPPTSRRTPATRVPSSGTTLLGSHADPHLQGHDLRLLPALRRLGQRAPRRPRDRLDGVEPQPRPARRWATPSGTGCSRPTSTATRYAMARRLGVMYIIFNSRMWGMWDRQVGGVRRAASTKYKAAPVRQHLPPHPHAHLAVVERRARR